jgi:hypothetical protein
MLIWRFWGFLLDLLLKMRAEGNWLEISRVLEIRRVTLCYQPGVNDCRGIFVHRVGSGVSVVPAVPLSVGE